jgi:cytochrome c peroxidase
MARMFHRTNRPRLTCLAALLLLVAAGGVNVMKAQTQTTNFTCYGGFTEEAIPLAPPLMSSLATVENPLIPKDPITGNAVLREDLAEYVASLPAAIRLGKALFWDMQAGSDNKTACATCHFHAGEDGRTRNQLHPGPNGQWDAPGFGPNADLWSTAFPFTQPGISDTDNIAGSQGIRRSTFTGISKSGAETFSLVSDPVFSVNGQNVRQVTGRNAPSTINAVFNARLFHDGRAQPEFNGVNPLGNRDASARVWVVGVLGPTQIDIHIADAPLASQSVGPILNSVEMSASGRTWTDLGRKLMTVKPLGLQKVSATDSVLGFHADPAAGLTTTYKAMIQAAFQPKWWNSTKTVSVNRKSYTVMEANTSLFWGLSVALYQATLVSDQTPIDRYLAARAALDPNAALLLDEIAAQVSANYGQTITRDNILNGLRLFEMPPPPAPAPNGLGCMLCHVGAEMTSASFRNLNHGVEADDVAFVNGGFDQRMERMFWQIPPVAPGTDQISLNPLAWTVSQYNTTTPAVPPLDAPLAIYDTGYYNIGVRPTAEDRGADGVDPFGTSWSIVRMLQSTFSDPSFIKVPGAAINCGATVVKNSTGYPLLSGALRKTERTRVTGAFKTPNLRNVELNAPYFHNGGKATLFQVMEFYDDGGDFANFELAPLIRPLGMTPDQIRDVIAFLLALTDERVRYQRAPFDHPQLFVPNGVTATGADNLVEVPPTGAAGGQPLGRFLNLNPFMQ